MDIWHFVWMYHILFIHLPGGGHLYCFHFSPIMNNAAVNIHEQVFVWTYVFSYLGHKLKSRITRSYGNYVYILRNCQIVFSKWLQHFTFPPVRNKGSKTSTFLPTLVIAHPFYFRHCGGFESMHYMISILLNLLRCVLWLRMWSIIVNFQSELEKNVQSAVSGWICL